MPRAIPATLDPLCAPALWKPARWASMPYAVKFRRDGLETCGGSSPAFTLAVEDRNQLDWILRADLYSVASAFIRGAFDIDGDIVAAIHFRMAQGGISPKTLLYSLLARLAPRRIESLWQSRARAAGDIRFHYDRSNEFYRQFLDSRMVYSCAYFKEPDWPLDRAQEAKLDLICRKLDLREGERFLDVGCGWGGLVIHAALQYGAVATGCTLSPQQVRVAVAAARGHGVQSAVDIRQEDYRDLDGTFDKIASVGMFEHVGRRRLRGYFRKIHALLAPDGLFLNHGIVRPGTVKDGVETYFLQRRVFPGGELVYLPDVIREAERSGFEVLDVENLRPHYALTCRAWVERLQQNAAACQRLAGLDTYRTWLLYLAGSAASFESATTEVHQLLLGKRGPGERRRLDRGAIYSTDAPSSTESSGQPGLVAAFSA